MMDNALEIACKHYNRAIDFEETIEHLEEIIEQFCMDAEAAPQRSLTNEQIDKVHQHAQGLRVTYDLFHREYARRIISEFLASGAAPAQEPVAWIEHQWSGSGQKLLHFERPTPTIRDEVVNPIWKPLFLASGAAPAYRKGCKECADHKHINDLNAQWQKDVAKGREIIASGAAPCK